MIFDRFFTTEKRSLENPLVPISSPEIDKVFGITPTYAGTNVNRDTALSVAAFWSGARLLAGTIASLPLKVYEGGEDRKEVDVQVLDEPYPEITPFEFWEYMVLCDLLHGNAYAEMVYNGLGEVAQLLPIQPDLVFPERQKNGEKRFKIGNRWFGPEKILHIPGMGYDGVKGLSVLQFAKQSLGLALAAEEAGARLFGSGSLMGGILHTEDTLPNVETADDIKRRWKEKVTGIAKAHEVAVLDRGFKFQPVTMPNEDAQWLESRAFQVEEIARWLGLPPHMLGATEKVTSWGAGIEAQVLGFLKFHLAPRLKRIEQRVTMHLLPKGQFAEFTVEGLLRPDTKSRYESYAIGLEHKFLVVNDIRALENKPLVPWGDEPITAPAPPVPEPPVEAERSLPITVNVALPNGKVVRSVERDEDGHIKRVVEEPQYEVGNED